MPVIVAFLLYAGHILRRPMDIRLKQRRGGPFLLTVLAAGVAAMWVVMRPSGLTDAYLWGELIGQIAVYLMSCSLVLATRARWLEPWFGGLDRMYLWHKRCAVSGTFLLIPHVVLFVQTPSVAANTARYLLGEALGIASLFGLLALVVISLPRAARVLRLTYYRWLLFHRFIGLWVLTALIHGLLLDQILASSAPLSVLYLVIGCTGTAAYAYAEVAMRRNAPSDGYIIERIERPSAGVMDLHLAPVSDGVTVLPGQFIFLQIGGDDTWREHPFSVSGVTPDGHLRLTIRSLGRDTSRMHARLVPGLPATVSGPYGMFDYTLGRTHQVWIAGGIGVAPFLSWLSVINPHDPYRIDLFYSTANEADAVYLSELRSAEQRLAPLLRVRPVFTRAEGHLTGAKVSTLTRISPETHVFLCGPAPMVEALSRDMRVLGVPADYIHSEHFAFR